MGVRRFLLGALLLAGLALLAPAAALADAPLVTGGALVYSWHGDPARGCARIGVCGIEGSLVVRPQQSALLIQPNHTPSGFIEFDTSSAIARVRRTEAGSSGDCVETTVWPNADSQGLGITWQRRGAQATLSLAQQDGPVAGHCAGPLWEGLPARLVGRRLPGRALRFSFPASLVFSAGPYTGTLISTLGFRPDTSGDSSSGSQSGGGAPPTHSVLDERVALTYRFAEPAATLHASLLGERDPFCATLDACGTSGGVSVSVDESDGTFMLLADRIVGHRVGRAGALADFRARKLLLNIPPGMGGSSSSTETLARPGGATCTDTRDTGQIASLWLGSPFDPPSFVIGPNGPVQPTGPLLQPRTFTVLMALDDPGDALRTACAGPNGTDVFGTNGVLARGVIDVRQLLARHLRVDLRPPASFSAPSYSGSISGSITLTMSLIRVFAGTVKEGA